MTTIQPFDPVGAQITAERKKPVEREANPPPVSFTVQMPCGCLSTMSWKKFWLIACCLSSTNCLQGSQEFMVVFLQKQIELKFSSPKFSFFVSSIGLTSNFKFRLSKGFFFVAHVISMLESTRNKRLIWGNEKNPQIHLAESAVCTAPFYPCRGRRLCDSRRLFDNSSKYLKPFERIKWKFQKMFMMSQRTGHSAASSCKTVFALMEVHFYYLSVSDRTGSIETCCIITEPITALFQCTSNGKCLSWP